MRREASAAHQDAMWTGETEMNRLRETIRQTFGRGSAHHIQRLMSTGLYAMLAGVEPRQIHEWYLAVSVDAVKWVELPKVVGTSHYDDGGIMASKPYAATGKSSQRMSNCCEGCRHDPAQCGGADVCPFTALYWDFLARNEPKLMNNARMNMQMKNLHQRMAAR